MQPVGPGRPGDGMQPASPMQWAVSPQRPDVAQAPTPARLVWGAPGRPRHPGRPSRGGRGIWALSGVVTVFLLALPVTLLIVRAGRPDGGDAITAQPVSTRTVTITQPVTSVSIQSYGGDIRVIGGGAGPVQVTESISSDPQQGLGPRVISAVAGGQLILDASACVTQNCSVGFTVTVPSTVSVTAVTQGASAVVSGVAGVTLETDGGNIVASGVAGGTLDSGGGNVLATSVSGPLTVTSGGGTQQLTGIGGTLKSESGGGGVIAQGITGPAATITTDGGPLTAMGLSVPAATLSSGGGDARIIFAAAPGVVVLTTDGGNATVNVPGGPYALTADSGGGPQTVGIATNPTASRSLTVTTGDGALVIEPSTGSAPTSVPISASPNGAPPAPPAPPAAP